VLRTLKDTLLFVYFLYCEELCI